MVAVPLSYKDLLGVLLAFVRHHRAVSGIGVLLSL